MFLHSKTIGISISVVCILVATIAYVSLTMLDEATKEIHDLSERLGTPPTSHAQQENRTYEQAFNQGFDAFMRQYGIPQKTWKYTSQEMHTTENFDLNAEKIFMGYADGYHAAAKQVFGTGNCTR